MQKSKHLTMSEKKDAIKIIEYEPQFRKVFKELNQEWIEQYFKMEEADFKSLEEPEKNILDKGGFIFVALLEEEAVGVCALAKLVNHEYDYELAKMAVNPNYQGKGIGYLLGKAIIEKAQELEADSLYLESNTILEPAIRLYEKLGFIQVFGMDSPYERSNIQMVLTF